MTSPVSTDAIAEVLKRLGFDTAFGVPDSLLEGLEESLSLRGMDVTVCANEGSALAMAGGAFLGSGRCAIVFLQNSGVGNLQNPLTSLIHESVYRIPVLLLVGWRGSPGTADEPQHVVQGEITIDVLQQSGVATWEVSSAVDWSTVAQDAVHHMERFGTPVALLLKNTQNSVGNRRPRQVGCPPRIDVLRSLWMSSNQSDVFFLTTGKSGREMLLVTGDDGQRVFLNVGAMGHTGSMAVSFAQKRPTVRTYCIDGDGAFQMHMGAAASIGRSAPNNFLHVVLSNGVHESVGSSPIANPDIDYDRVMKGLGYNTVVRVGAGDKLDVLVTEAWQAPGPRAVIVDVVGGGSSALPRPSSPLVDRRLRFAPHSKAESVR